MIAARSLPLGDVSFESVRPAAKATGGRAVLLVAGVDACRVRAQIGNLIPQATAPVGALGTQAGHARTRALVVRPAAIWMLSADGAVAAVACWGAFRHDRKHTPDVSNAGFKVH